MIRLTLYTEESVQRQAGQSAALHGTPTMMAARLALFCTADLGRWPTGKLANRETGQPGN